MKRALQARQPAPGAVSGASQEVRRHELLEGISGIVERVLREHGIEENLAAQAGAATADEVSVDHAGQMIYVPYDHAFRLAPRDREILEAHRNGVPLAELRHRYRMTDAGLRKLLRRAASRDPHLNQLHLFGGDR